jgi:hypothetical protein
VGQTRTPFQSYLASLPTTTAGIERLGSPPMRERKRAEEAVQKAYDDLRSGSRNDRS